MTNRHSKISINIFFKKINRMKKKAFIMATLVCSSFVLMSCDDDDDKFTPESIVTKAFDTKYPDAQRVSWENEAGYVKAEFYTGSYEAEAWFDPQGNWMLTETDLPYKALPQTVKNSFEASLYAKWKIDDVDMLERPVPSSLSSLQDTKARPHTAIMAMTPFLRNFFLMFSVC